MNELNLLETEYALNWMNKKGERHWHFNFNGDGWNTIWARTQEDAWRKAEQEYGLNLN